MLYICNFKEKRIVIGFELFRKPIQKPYRQKKAAQKGGFFHLSIADYLRSVFSSFSEKLAFALDGYSRANAFTKEDSPEPMHPQSPTRYLKKLSDHCGLPDLRPHKLRHTFASVAITNGADVANVSEALGHSDKAVTLRMYQRRELIVGQTAETGGASACREPHRSA